MKWTAVSLAALLAFTAGAGCGGGSSSTTDPDGGTTIIKSGTLPTDAQLCSFVSGGTYGTTTGQQVLDAIGSTDANVSRDGQGNIVDIAYDYSEHTAGQPPTVQVTTGFLFDASTHQLTCVGRGGLGSSAHPLPSCLPNTNC